MADKREIALRFFWKMKDAGYIKPEPSNGGYYLYSPEGKRVIIDAVNAPTCWTALFVANENSDAADTPIDAVWLPATPSRIYSPGNWSFMYLNTSQPYEQFAASIEAVAEKLGLDMTGDEYVDIDDLVF